MPKTYIIDGNSLLFRSFYALFRPGEELMHSQDGTPTNAIYSFHNMMKTIKSKLTSADKMIVCFDTDSKTFRSKELETYKKNRKPLEPQLAVQMPIARKLLEAMGIFFYELPGYEGDDVAGSLAKYGSKLGDEIILFTSDKDFLQLLDENIKVNFLRKGLSEIEVFTKDNIYEKLGFRADQVTDYKGLVGDASDNFKGIPGIGDKTAVKLLNLHDNLEGIIEAMKSETSKTAKNIVEHAEEGRFCKHIATIITDIDGIEDVYAKGQIKDFDYKTLKAFFNQYDLIKFSKQLDEEMKRREGEQMSLDFDSERAESYDNFGFAKKSSDDIQVKPITSVKGLKIKSIVSSHQGSNDFKGEIQDFYLCDGSTVYSLSLEDAKNDTAFKELLTSDEKKSTYDYKNLIVVCSRLGLPRPLNFDFDLLLATYLIDPDTESEPNAVISCYGTMTSSLSPYVCLAKLSCDLHDEVTKELKAQEEYELLTEVEIPLTEVLADMEIEGFPIDLETLEEINKVFKTKLAKIKQDIFGIVGHEFNLNSPNQVATVLYDELEIPVSKSAKRSTSFEVLKSIKHLNPVVSFIIEYRKTNKSITSYTEALPQHVYEDGKLHAMFNQALTTTGRLSMSEPNMQNISIRNEEAKVIRKAFFYPNKEYYILSLDYSQIELRMIASLANIDDLIKAFNEDEDVHNITASACFHVPVSEVTHSMRSKAKAVNFGIVYGISTYGLSEQLEIPVGEAKEIMTSFHNHFKGLEEYNTKVLEFANQHEYVKTIANRRRYLKDIHSSNHTLREFSKRAAINATVQGSAADLIKVAMIRIADMLKDYKTKMVLQIHDELIFKVPKDELDIITKKIKDIMENAMKLKCRLKVEGSAAFVWYDAK